MSVINREDTINYLMTNMHWHDEYGYTVEDADEKRAIITDLINGVPDADDGWIPVEEKLPDNNTDVLLQFSSNMGVGFYEDGDWAVNTGDGIYSEIGYNEEMPIAWRLLPPAFKSKEDEQ